MRAFLYGLGLTALLATSQVASAAFDSADAPTSGPLEIIRVTPEGEDVPAGKQVVIQFNRAVVPIGKMDRTSAELPIIITPALKCDWRWINTSALACNLPDEAPLTPATQYSVEVKPGIKAEDGATIADTYSHEFVTERPAISYKEFKLWKSASYPIIRAVFNQPVDKDSIEQHFFLAVGDNGESTVHLTVRPDPEDRDPPQFMPIPGEKKALLFAKGPKQHSDDQLRRDHGKEARRIWLLEPKHELRLDSNVVLKAEAGLKSALGEMTGLEDKSIVQFQTYPKFEFLGTRCRSNDNNEIVVKNGEEAKDKCNPMGSIALEFSAPVHTKDVARGVTFEPKVGGWSGVSDDDEAEGEGESDTPYIGYEYRRPHEKGRTYSVWMPNGLKAAQLYTGHTRANDLNWFERLWHWIKSLFRHTDPIAVQDIFGRPLENAFNAAFLTDHRSPNYVLDYSDAVLEKNVDSEMPFYVNNLEQYHFGYRKFTTQGLSKDEYFNKDVPQVRDIQFAVPFGIRDMLGGKPGAVFGTLSSTPQVNNGYRPTLFAQVTPWQVHFKLGHFTSMAWVTDMASGEPVSGVKIGLYVESFPTLGDASKPSASATSDANGIALLPGTQTLDPDLMLTREYDINNPRYFVRASKGEDMAILPVSGAFEINSYRSSGSESVYPSNQVRYGHMKAWGTTAQGIYRAGDTIQYKLYVRNQDNARLVPPPTAGYRLKIIDPMGKVVAHVKDVKLSAFGGYAGEFTVPKEGAVGWYSFKLIADFAKKDSQSYDEESDEQNEVGADGRQNEEADEGKDKKSWEALRVLVSDFTPVPFKVSNQLNGDRFHAEQQVNVMTHAELHSGGAYTDAATRITAMLDAQSFSSKHPVAKDFQFDSYPGELSSQQLFQKSDEMLNNKGELALDFTTGKPGIVYGKLTVESAVADDRGKYVAGSTTADYVGVDRLVGLHSKEWVYSAGKPADIQYLVVDDQGTPAAGTDVDVAVEYQSTKAARVKGAGNAYLSEYHTEWQNVATCKGKSAAEPSTCSFTPEKAGSYRLIAKIKDTKGRDHSTTLSTYVTGRDFVIWSDENDTSLAIIPQSTSYKVGDTARFLVKNPYPGAKALITVERYGVIDSFVQTFDNSTPMIELPIKPDYLPGFYLSVVITSPRVEKPLGEGNVDLGKPAIRMGYVSVPVKDPYKEIAITSTTDRAVYKPRDKVTVKLHAEPRMKDRKEPIELTVAVLDESVFDLITGGKANFDPYAGFYKLESLDLRNYSLLTRLIGRQKFEKKGANPGGDGGADLSMRSVFKFVSYWNGALKTDANGNATISFDAPDNLTGWRILAIASTPTDRFGLGDANFKVNRPTEVRPVMPNQVSEGDRFDAGFSVMNRTDKPREITVNIKAEGNFDAAKTPATLTKKISLAPYKRETVFMPIQTTSIAQKREVAAGELRFTVTAGDATDQDGMVHTMPVNKSRNLEVGANYGTTTSDHVEESILFPKEMLPDTGSLSVVASPTVIGNIAGAFTYVRDYPYLCWEQRLTKGVMASHYTNLRAYLPDSLTWDGSDTLPQTTLNDASSFQAPNGGMAYFIGQDAYVDPYLSAYTALGFNWLRASGYKVPEEVETKLQSYLNNLLKNDAMPDFYSEGMSANIRAVALAALAENNKVALSDLERYAPHVKKMSLFGKTYFLQAAMAVKGGEKYVPDVAKQILAMSNETGGKFVFSETLDDSYTRILASPLRENCAVLDAFVKLGEREDGRQLVGDVPFKLMRSITQSRGKRDHWENTQENMFCLNALTDFARVYEKDKPAMTVTAKLNNEPMGTAKFADVKDPAVTLERLNTKADVGQSAKLGIDREGSGRLYYATRLSYALPASMSKERNAGIEIHREYSVERNGKWELLKTPAEVKRGEIVRVDLYVSAPTARNFVVVDDAVPGGLEPINRELATSSAIDAKKGEFAAAGGSFWFKYSDWSEFAVSRWNFYHQELRHDSARFYSDYLPAGNYHLSYTAQVIATGEFSARPARVEEMYDPDVYGLTEGLSLKSSENAAVNAAPAAPAKP